MNLYKRIVATTDSSIIPARAVILNTRKNINYYDTFCLYCQNNSIDVEDVSDKEFDNCVDMLESFTKTSARVHPLAYFWIE